ncbi:type II toxin-antitoxin system VapB family antitoxin [Nocardiopsis sp. HNM0947]|uniref:Type II toxin-antitoxin system VapB family antitoxin n=1 Tax=Nocardiopsis coralli TaxID=2772213 RepID=A0ABR9PCT8_9ACTN|nr:type II toxin-antitoxin system VapB family antitoxin [Nocardiopsis coralli]MBE3001661.1 type II toxin-antitoxin system VapB family antitoxin [Nocardiopsis coralli]
MSEVLIDIDETALARAAELLGTTEPSETVGSALRVIISGDRASALAEMRRLVAEGALDIHVLRDKRR